MRFVTPWRWYFQTRYARYKLKFGGLELAKPPGWWMHRPRHVRCSCSHHRGVFQAVLGHVETAVSPGSVCHQESIHGFHCRFLCALYWSTSIRNQSKQTLTLIDTSQITAIHLLDTAKTNVTSVLQPLLGSSNSHTWVGWQSVYPQ